MDWDYDVVIVGAGLVGATLAVALGGRGLKVAAVESVPLHDPAQPSYDERVIALGEGSRRILAGLGLWPAVAPTAEPILQIHVSDRGHGGKARLLARDEGVDALGHVTPARVLGNALAAALGESGVDLLCPARLSGVDRAGDLPLVRVAVGDETLELTSRLVVVADGGRSPLREQLGVRVRERPYGQTALTTTVTPERPHQGVAYERFTRAGPLALLPMTDGRCALVWTFPGAAAEAARAWPEALFLARLQARFGRRLGRFVRLGRRHTYPLTRVTVEPTVGRRFAVIGNAAHTLHPVAGQGFNLGLRDVAVLAEVLADAAAVGADPGAASLLAAYARRQQRDQARVGLFTDTLVRVFSNGFPPLVAARNLGLVVLDLAPPAKHLLARQAMGLAGWQPRLARGLPL